MTDGYNFHEYVEDREPFEDYMERFEAYCKLRDVSEADQVLLFISKRGPLYSTLKKLVYPKKPCDLQFKDIKDKLLGHLAPVPLQSLQRIKFRGRRQKESEPFNEFYADLKAMAATTGGDWRRS
ncbi:Hypothetical protein NTJ_04358 [Nesidiocoris tenuis]|uniref:Retrotransposon gag domain-containing protein n=1 Tax=Nesidiocoris tenuis TaxID=355587 RepID=A0ABN7AJI4_9HEMI|nr:Hypothetical protein NTJ_04358 [Nesidiocoris tenuis]